MTSPTSRSIRAGSSSSEATPRASAIRRSEPKRFIATGNAVPVFSKSSARPPCFTTRSAISAISSTGFTHAFIRTNSPSRSSRSIYSRKLPYISRIISIFTKVINLADSGHNFRTDIPPGKRHTDEIRIASLLCPPAAAGMEHGFRTDRTRYRHRPHDRRAGRLREHLVQRHGPRYGRRRARHLFDRRRYRHPRPYAQLQLYRLRHMHRPSAGHPAGRHVATPSSPPYPRSSRK